MDHDARGLSNAGRRREALEVNSPFRDDDGPTIPIRMPELSVLIPAHNEAASLGKLLGDLVLVLQRWDEEAEWEAIVVDDGSADETWEVAARYADRIPNVRVVRLDRNLGQSTALSVAVEEARGKWLATLDADGQNDPADIPRLWSEAVATGADAVLGWRQNRQDNLKTRWVSKIANKVRNAFLGQTILDTGCSTRLLRASFLADLPRFEGWHRFLGPMIAARGGTITQIPVAHHAREHGRSHYHWRNRGLKVVVDLFGVAWLNRRVLRASAIAARSGEQVIRIDDPHESHDPNVLKMRPLPDRPGRVRRTGDHRP